MTGHKVSMAGMGIKDSDEPCLGRLSACVKTGRGSRRGHKRASKDTSLLS